MRERDSLISRHSRLGEMHYGIPDIYLGRLLIQSQVRQGESRNSRIGEQFRRQVPGVPARPQLKFPLLNYTSDPPRGLSSALNDIDWKQQFKLRTGRQPGEFQLRIELVGEGIHNTHSEAARFLRIKVRWQTRALIAD
jgi:hypothetical protein